MDENNGMVMPVSPYGGNGYGNSMFGGGELAWTAVCNSGSTRTVLI